MGAGGAGDGLAGYNGGVVLIHTPLMPQGVEHPPGHASNRVLFLDEGRGYGPSSCVSGAL